MRRGIASRWRAWPRCGVRWARVPLVRSAQIYFDECLPFRTNVSMLHSRSLPLPPCPCPRNISQLSFVCFITTLRTPPGGACYHAGSAPEHDLQSLLLTPRAGALLHHGQHFPGTPAMSFYDSWSAVMIAAIAGFILVFTALIGA